MTHQEELKQLFQEAQEKGLVMTQGDFAKLLEMSEGGLSKAFNGKGNVNPANVVLRARKLVNGESGNVQVGSGNTNGIPAKKFENEQGWFTLVAEKDRQIDRLLTIIEKMQA